MPAAGRGHPGSLFTAASPSPRRPPRPGFRLCVTKCLTPPVHLVLIPADVCGPSRLVAHRAWRSSERRSLGASSSTGASGFPFKVEREVPWVGVWNMGAATSFSVVLEPHSAGRMRHSLWRMPDSCGRMPQSPGRTPRSSGRKSHSSWRKPNSSERTPHSSWRKSRSPERTRQSSWRKPQSPERTPQSPERTPQSPWRTPHSSWAKSREMTLFARKRAFLTKNPPQPNQPPWPNR